ncbi:MAG: DsbA family protein [Hyphomicrobiaceae bacterium]|nr:DsbA family protein [Hyphomicrobiaceae bacterium]
MLAGLVAAAAVLSGCAGESSLGEALQSADAARAGGVAAGQSADEPRFDPFSEAGSGYRPARQVIENPSPAEVMRPGPLPEMAIGRADAPVTIIKYASLTCPYCRKFHLETFPQLKRDYIDTGKVRFILREFPIGFQSGAATIALRCAPPGRYFELYGRFMAEQARWVSQEVRRDPIFKVAAQVGMTRAQFDACYQNQGMIDALNQVKERGRTLGVIGTPNFFVDGRLVKTVIGMKEIREMVEPVQAGKASPGATTAN